MLRCALGLALGVAVLLLVDNAPAAQMSAFAGPYWLMVRNLSSSPEAAGAGDDVILMSMMHHSRNRSKDIMFSGNATIKNDVFVRGASTVTIDAARWDSVSGWREHFLVMPLGEFCFAMEEVGGDVIRLINRYIPNIPKKCPIPNGFYSARGVPTRLRLGQLGHFPVLPFGRYRARVFCYRTAAGAGRKPRSCAELEVDVNPKV